MHIINRLPQPKLGFITPYEKLWKIKATVIYFKVFGSTFYVLIPKTLHNKLEKKTLRCIFVRYDTDRKGYRCCDSTTNRCYTSLDVVFYEASSWWIPKTAKVSDTREEQKLKTKETLDGEHEEQK
ncbi:hypothetical protein AMTR_s00162p00033520 [Amborella trichopoda]|uniref:Retroviral polymerase SH3-like domain-containing protein n=1 Tax=Amborella trichopoda TaxID=13333 RepID=W1PQ53_AMBTC|nr:hypothetical protein AMTR_s00162p00033520 [Amborella trichopoda]